MIVRAKRSIALLLAFFMIVTSIQFLNLNNAYAATVDEVLAAIGELSSDPRDFTAADTERVEAIQADYDALSAEDQATIDSTFDHPSGDGQSYGRILEAALWAVRSYGTDTSTTLAPGTYTTTSDPAVSSESNKGKSDSSRTRNWWVESVVVENGQATANIYVTSGAATAAKLTSYPSVWIGGQSIERNSDNNNYSIPVDLNGTTYFGGVSSSMPRPIMYKLNTTIEEPDPVEPVQDIELTITNNTGMFKAETASLHPEGDKTYLVMALSGTGYKELYKGTYEQAVANGDGSADKGNDSWIHGYTNADGKIEFKIPVEEGETYMPLVAVSNSYYGKYLNGQNSLARAFYPRQLTVDADAKTLVTGDYEFSQDLTVTNNIKMFKTPAAKLDTVGGPNSNNYKADLVLTMQNDSYDAAFVGTYAEADKATKTIALSEENVFTIPVKWVETFGDPETLKTLADGEPFYLSFRSKKNGTWYERIATLDEEAKTLVFDPSDADYTAVDAAIAAIPTDLSIYTDESAAAVTAAQEAVVRDKFKSQQAEVDAMAKAINDAVAALEEKPHVHELTKVDSVPATCTEPGTEEYWECSCGKKFSDAEGKTEIDAPAAIPALGHDITVIKETVDPGFGTEGHTLYECSRNCGETKTETIPSLKAQAEDAIQAAEDAATKAKTAEELAAAKSLAEEANNKVAAAEKAAGEADQEQLAELKNANADAQQKAAKAEEAIAKEVNDAAAKAEKKAAGYTEAKYMASSVKAIKAALKSLNEAKAKKDLVKIQAATKELNDAIKTASEKKATTIKVLKKSNKKAIKAGGKKLKKKKTFTVKTKASSGAKTTYKKVGKSNKKITINSKGKVTLKKGLKKGKYTLKVKVSAKYTANAKAAAKTIKVIIKIK